MAQKTGYIKVDNVIALMPETAKTGFTDSYLPGRFSATKI